MRPRPSCPDCGDTLTRRSFVGRVAGAAVAAALAREPVWASTLRQEKPETLVRLLYESLTPEQRKATCFPWGDPGRKKVFDSWSVVPQTVGKFYTPDQQQLLRDIFQGLLSDDGRARFARSMKDDYGGFENFHPAIFGDPGTDQWEWVLTGRHLTLRCDGNTQENVSFGGPMFYGHSAEGFFEKPDHPGNVFWRQAILANKVFAALDGTQQTKALVPKSPLDQVESVRIKKSGPWNGIRVGELSRDQKALVEETLTDLLAPFREQDSARALSFIKEKGNLDQVHLAFYQEGDLGDDRVWDRWGLEGPTVSWYFRGSPHVHTWVHIARV